MPVVDDHVYLEFGERKIELTLDWSQVIALREKLGDQWQTLIFKALHEHDLKEVADTLVMLAGKNHPDLSADEIIEGSPTYQEVIDGVEAVVCLFMFGRTTSPMLEEMAAANSSTTNGAEEPETARQSWAKNGPGLLARVFGRS